MTLGAYILLAALAGLAATPQEFARYPAESALQGDPAAVKLNQPKARRFRTVLRRAAAAGPNFNGHYTVVHWGCGSNCIEWAVIDLATGDVWFAPEPVVSCQGLDAGGPTEWLEVSAHSRLMYLNWCSHQHPETTVFDRRTVFEWKDGQAAIVRSEPLE